MNPGGFRPPPTSGGPPTAGWARCDVCNSELPVQFTQLPCLHRFCPSCTGITQERKACPLCVNRSLAKNMGALHLGPSGPQRAPQPNQAAPSTSSSASSPPFFADLNQPVSDPLTVDTSFLIWDPPKMPPQQHSAHRTPQQQPRSVVDVNSYPSVGDEQPSSPLFSPNSSLSAPQHLGVYSTNFNLAPGAPPNPSPWSQPPPSRPPIPLCTSCSEGVVATSRCEECRELLCAGCVQAHYRVRMTRDHRVLPLSSVNVPLRETTQTSSGSSGHSPLASQSSNPAVCGPHESLPLLYCQTCKQMPLCAQCLPEHKGHTFNNQSQDAKQLLAQLIVESKQYQRGLEEAVESVQRMAERVEASVQAVVGEVRSVLHMHISALEERKRDLLQRIDTVRHSKIGTLKTQSELLHNRLAALNHALAQAESSLADNSADSTDAKSMQELLIGQLQESRSLLMPHETDQLRFTSPDPALLTSVRALGEIQSGACARTSHIVGDSYKRAIRDRPAFFTVQAKDATSDQCLAGGDPVTLEVVAPDGTRPQTQIRDRQNGTYIASYMPTMDGVHLLQLKIRGCPILNSPMTVQVRKGRNYADIGPTPLFSFGGEGGNDGQLCRPWGICCDRDGRIVVADRSNNRVQIFDKNGRFITKFGSSGARAGQFDRPAGVTVNNKNQLIVADKDNHRIQVFESDGTFVFKFGERGRGVGMFNYPWDVACNTENDIAVSDTRNHRVQVFTASGQFLRKFGFDNSLFFKHLDSPRGVCYLPDGQLLITDFNNHRLAIVSNNSNDIKFYGREGDADGAFRRPQGVDVDPEGHVIIADSRNNRLQVLAPDDLRPLCSFGCYGDRSSVMDRPSDVCTSPDGRIYVVDFGNNKVHVF